MRLVDPSHRPGPGRHGFPRIRRLTQREQFRRIFEQSKRVDAGYFVMLVRPNSGAGARLGLAIAKRSCPGATDRNRLKRVVRESFRAHRHLLPPVDVVVLSNAKTRYAANRELFQGLEGSWRKIRGNRWVASSS